VSEKERAVILYQLTLGNTDQQGSLVRIF